MAYGEEQPGLMSPMNIIFATQGIWRHSRGLMSEFYGDEALGSRRRALRSIGRYGTGRPLDQQTARRLAGRTWASKQYAGLTEKSPVLRALAPNLSFLGPSRYLSLWAGLAGHEGATAGLAAMAGIQTVADEAAKANINAFGRAGGETLFGNMTAYDVKAAKASGRGFFESYMARHWEHLGSWGRQVGPDSVVREEIRAGAARLAAGDVTAGYKIVNETGGFSSSLYQRYGNFISRRIAGGNKFFIGMGKYAIPGVAKVGATLGVGVDLYTIGTLMGSLAGKAGIAAMKQPISMYNAVTADIHRGTFMSSSPLSPFVGATNRQRAMANIYDRQLNLRQVLGNEAAYMSRL